MRFEVRLLQADAERRVVQVRALSGDSSLGSALGEAADAEEAEDRAMRRLCLRLGQDPPGLAAAAAAAPAGAGAGSGRRADPLAATASPLKRSARTAAAVADVNAGPDAARSTSTATSTGIDAHHPAGTAGDRPAPAERAARSDERRGADVAADKAPPDKAPAELAEKVPEDQDPADQDPADQVTAEQPPTHPASHQPEQPARRTDKPGEPAAVGEPEDWSDELTRLEMSLRRIGWSRDQEGEYLRRAFGHPSRSRITEYGELKAYLRMLESLEPGADPALAAVPLRRRDLLAQSDQLLLSLGWDEARARGFSGEQLGVRSRSQLSDTQLLQFNMLLEAELIAAMEPSST